MNPTTRPLAPDLLASLRPLRRAARGVVLTLGLLGAVVGLAAPASASHGTGAGGGKVSMQRHVNEYEGQHRLGIASNDPDVPVTPTLARKVNEYEGQHRIGEPAPEPGPVPTG